PSEWGVRLWSALPALGVALLIWHLGELLYGGRAGLLSALVFVSSVGVFRYVRVAATDFLLVFSITLAIYGFVRAALSQSPRTARRWSVVFWLGMALGVLSKGLVGLIFPLLIVGLYLLVNSKWQIVNDEWPIASGERRIANGGGRRLFASPLGILLFLALVLPWHLLAALKNPGFFQFYIVDNQLLRFFNRRGFIEDDVPVSTLAFLGLTLVWFFPWSLLLPASLRCGFPRLSLTSSLRERLRLVVGLWAVVVLGFFSLSSSKLEHYVLPAVPPLSLWVGALWSEVLEGRDLLSAGKWRFLGLGWWLGISALGCGLAGVGLFWFSHLLTPQMLLAGLAELNVYYRILQGEGTGFPFASVLPFVGLLKVLGVALAVGLPAALVVYRFRLPALSFAAFLATAGV
ncbi:MAG TPA: phospholipid carrier-dependent glycosyltransferase, partial [Anaerolineales bacterium]